MTGPPRPSTAAADRGGRAGAWAVVAVAVAALVAFGALYVLLRDPILVGLGRLAGPSRPGAVALGWALWALPLAITVVSAARWPKGLPRRARWALATVIAASWLPAALLFPTSRGGAAHALAEALVRDAPDVAAAIFAGIVAGLLSTIAGAGAWMVVGGLRGNRLGLACCAAASLLGLGGALALHGHGPRGLGAEAFFPAAADRFDGISLRRLAVAETSSCTGATTSPEADRTLRDDGCGRVVRALVAPDGSDALVAVSIVAMPSPERAERAVERLSSQSFAPAPLAVPAAARRELAVRSPAGAAMLVRISHADAYVLILGALHGDGRGSADPGPLLTAMGQVRFRIVRVVISA